MDGCEWIVDADLRDFFGTVHHERLINMIAEEVSDGRILRLVRKMLEFGYMESGKKSLLLDLYIRINNFHSGASVE